MLGGCGVRILAGRIIKYSASINWPDTCRLQGTHNINLS